MINVEGIVVVRRLEMAQGNYHLMCSRELLSLLSVLHVSSIEKMEKESEAFFKGFAVYAPGNAGTNTDAAFIRNADTLWSAMTHVSSALAGGGSKPLTIELGKTTLSESERWALQAAMRREGGREYNKKLMRPTKTTKGPTPGEAFPPGRGRPVR